LPETLIGGNPILLPAPEIARSDQVEKLSMRSIRAAGKPILAAFRDPSRVHAMCEDYRAGAYADFEIDRKIATPQQDHGPMLALWGRCRHRQRRRDAARHWKTWRPM